MASQEIVLAGADGSEGEQVITSVLHPDGEANGLGGTILTDNIIDRIQIGRGLERQFADVASSVEHFGR
jgi:hypothetical protein